ncbi:MAG TPA: IclR family transcriptional regulator C-terminal domain-containing protein, partial [Ramlibacter sp.]
LRYSVECNRLQPLAWGAAGHAILAFLPDAEIAQVIEQKDASPLGRKPLPPEQLRKSLARTREAGYAASFGQRAEDMHGIAVPFFDRAGQVRGNILLNIPHFRFRPEREQVYVQLLRKAAHELQRRMGWSG